MRKLLHPADLIWTMISDVNYRLGLALLLTALASGQLVAAPFQPGEQASATREEQRYAGRGSFIRDEDRRIAAIAYRLARLGAPLCSKAAPLTGLFLHHLPEYSPVDQATMIAVHALDRGPGVLTVLDGSPAAEADLRAGDTVLSVNGREFPVPADRSRENWREATEVAERLLEDELSLGAAELRVLRDGKVGETLLTPISGCPARIRLARSAQVNAFASGRTVVVTTGVVGFTRNEDELAVVIAHEMAHNIMAHPDRLRAQKVPRGLLRGIGRNAARVRATEEEADRLAIRLMWMAGYDVTAAIPFWRRFYAKYDTMPQLFRTHPSLEARERLIGEVIAALGAPAGAPYPPAGRR